MHWKARLGISLCAAAVALSSILLCGMTPTEQISAETEAVPPAAEAALETGTAYSLRNYKGWIGIYHGEELLCCSEILVDTLPDSDRTLLETGIEAQSWDNLLLLLEDFSS